MNARRSCMVLLCCVLIAGFSFAAQATPSAPTLCVQTFGTKVYVSWNVVEGSSKYILSYAPAPYTGPASIASADMGGGISVWADRWPGASFYLAVQSSDGVEMSDYSNIEYFALPAAAANRSFSTDDDDGSDDSARATVTIAKGSQIGCALCHENKITHE